MISESLGSRGTCSIREAYEDPKKIVMVGNVLREYYTPCLTYKVEVLETLKINGSGLPETITVRDRETSKSRHTTASLHLDVGERYVLFLQKEEKGFRSIYEIHLGERRGEEARGLR